MLSKVEHVERLRALPASQRLRYTVLLSVIVAAAFVASVGLAIVVATVLFTLVDGALPTVEDLVSLGLPITLAFLAAIGFTSNPPSVGRTVQETRRKAAQVGARNGFVTGLVFGVLWTMISGLTAVRFERWDLIFRAEVLLFGLALGIAIGPALAVYRAVTSIIESVVLKAVQGQRSEAAR